MYETQYETTAGGYQKLKWNIHHKSHQSTLSNQSMVLFPVAHDTSVWQSGSKSFQVTISTFMRVIWKVHNKLQLGYSKGLTGSHHVIQIATVR